MAMKSCGPYMSMVIIQLAYGGGNILMKISLEKGLNQLVFIVYRHIIAMVLLCPFAYVLERKNRPSLSFWLMVKIFVIATLGTTIHLNLYYAGINYTSPTVASALSNVIPGLTMTTAILFGMENVKDGSTRGKAKVLGTLICIGGSLIFTFWKGENIFKDSTRRPIIQILNDHRQENWVKGSILILVSNVACSAWIILQGVVYKTYPAQYSLNVLICFIAALQTSLLALIWGRNPAIWRIGWNVQLFTILYCGIAISALVYCLQTWCISEKGPVFAAMFSPLQLVIVGLFSAIVFGERLHLGSLIGAFVIIVGLYCVLWGKSKDISGNVGETSNKATIQHEDKIIEISMDNYAAKSQVEERDSR